MRLAYYIAYNPITKTYVGVLKRAYKEKLEFLAASLPYTKYKGDFWGTGHVFDVYFSSEILPELIKVFNNRLTDIKYYSSKKANQAVVYFMIPDRIASTFPEEYAKYKHVVAVLDTSEIIDLRDAEKISLYDNGEEALDAYLSLKEELEIIDKYGNDSGPGAPSGSPKVSGILRRIRRSSLLYRPSRFERISSDLGRLERSGISLGSSWDFLFRGD
jgi:hypothetical protein